MSGHDIAAKPHKTTHEMVIDCVRGGAEAGASPWPRVCGTTRRDGIGEWSSAPKPHSGNRFLHPSEEAALHTSVAARDSTRQQATQPADAAGPLTQSIPVQWTRWPNVKPRASRFNDLETTR